MDAENRWIIQEKIGGGGQGDVFRCLKAELSKIQQDYFTELFSFNHAQGILNFTVQSGDNQRQRFWDSYRKLSEFDKLENQFVIKKLKPMATNKHFETAIQRTNNEISAMKKIKHPNLIELVDCDTVHEWYVSPYYQLGSLDRYLSYFAGNISLSLRFFRKIVAAVAELHKENVVHRDIKPHNIFLKSFDHPIVGDLGLTYFMGADDDRLTLTEESVGTKYWRPEWANGMRLDGVRPTFDVYSLGKILWALISGKPFLNLWYWDKPQFDVEKQYPDAKWIHCAKEIFRRTIVQEEEQCDPNASILLEHVDQLIKRTNEINEPFLARPERTCLACGIGKYQLEVDSIRNQMENFGWSPRGNRKFNILTCRNCGHLQAFTVESGNEPETWKTWGKE